MMLLLLLCFVTIQGFLLDGSTPLPKAGTVLTDSHFSMLLNLLVEERNSREQLEQIVKQNQQEIANINEKFRRCNCNKQDVNVNAINNKTAQLEQRVDVLQQTVHSVQVTNAQIRLQGEIKCTNSILNLTVSNLNRRMENRMQSMQNTLNSSLDNVNKTLGSAITQLAQISNRAILSVDAMDEVVPIHEVIPFKSVHTSYGIQNLTSVKVNGKFTCEVTGIYLISVFVSTNSNVQGYFYIDINTRHIAYAYTDIESYYHTSSASIVTNLVKGDTVQIKNGPEIRVYSTGSHFSIIQIG